MKPVIIDSYHYCYPEKDRTEFYVRDKTNILKELRTEVDVIKEKIYNEEKKKKDNNTKQNSDIENNKKE